MNLSFPAAVIAALLASTNAMAQNVDLTVTLKGIRDDAGNLRAGLYREPETFRKEDRALAIVSVAAVRGETTLVFKDIAPGRYAIMAYHDENADERLNLRLGMFPTEGYGLSNNPAVFGPPRFTDSAFDVSATGNAVEITLKY